MCITKQRKRDYLSGGVHIVQTAVGAGVVVAGEGIAQGAEGR